MRYLSTIVVVALLALLGGSGGEASYATMWRKYGAEKIMQNCFTPDGEGEWVTLRDKAHDYCNKQAASETLPVAPLPVAPLPDNVDWNNATNSSVRFTAAKIENLKQKLNKRVQVFRCVMQESQVTDSSFEVNPELFLAQYRALNLSDSLYADLEQAVHHCHQFTQCMPVEARSELAVPSDVIRTKAFIECETNLRYVACLKQDRKPNMANFDFSGLDGALDFLSSDIDKALPLMFANQEVGHSDYGLVE